MKAEKLSLYASFALLGGFLVRDVLKATVRVRRMAIRREQLQELYEAPLFQTLYFHPFYDNRLLARDIISLQAHKETREAGKSTMDPVLLETAEKGGIFSNEMNYSVYKLTKTDLKKILDHFSDASGVVYLLFSPVLYPSDNSYLAYQILPARADKKEIFFLGTSVEEPPPAPMPAPTDSTAGTEASLRAFALTASRTGRLMLNSSPPATLSVSYV